MTLPQVTLALARVTALALATLARVTLAQAMELAQRASLVVPRQGPEARYLLRRRCAWELQPAWVRARELRAQFLSALLF